MNHISKLSTTIGRDEPKNGISPRQNSYPDPKRYEEVMRMNANSHRLYLHSVGVLYSNRYTIVASPILSGVSMTHESVPFMDYGSAPATLGTIARAWFDENFQANCGTCGHTSVVAEFFGEPGICFCTYICPWCGKILRGRCDRDGFQIRLMRQVPDYTLLEEKVKAINTTLPPMAENTLSFEEVLEKLIYGHNNFESMNDQLPEHLNNKQAMFIIDHIRQLHEEKDFNELTPNWHKALVRAKATLEGLTEKTTETDEYVAVAAKLLDTMPLLELHPFPTFLAPDNQDNSSTNV